LLSISFNFTVHDGGKILQSNSYLGEVSGRGRMESIYELERLKSENSKLTSLQFLKLNKNTLVVKTKIMVQHNIKTKYFDRA